jgi:membrane fusion protein, epimerase transport system
MRHKALAFVNKARQLFLGKPSETPLSEEQELLNSDRDAVRFGYLVILVVFFGFGAWAAIAPLQSAAQGTGTVQVEGHRKLVQHLDGGIVTEILVANGDYVIQGQPLVKIDGTKVNADLNIVEGRLWAKRALVDRLLSERDDKDLIIATDWLVKLDDDRVAMARANERALFEARRADLLGEKEVLEQRIAQMRSGIQGTQAVLAAKKSIAASLSSEVDELQELLDEGYVDKQRIRQLERSRAQTLGEVSDLSARIASSEVSIDEAKLQILQLEKRFKTQVIDLLTRAEEELYDLWQRHAALKIKMERTTVRSPSDGIVLALKPNTIGAVVSGGEELMSIVPDTNKFLIDTKLSPMDIDRIQIGQEAEVRFSVFKDAYSITGELIKVSADSLIDKATGEPYFEAKVRLLDQDMKLLGEYRLVPGMPAEVLVKTGKRTLLGYLTSPLHRMFEESLIEG